MIVQKLIDDINKEAEAQKTIEDLIRESLIPQGVHVPEPDIVFGINGVSIFTKKSISTLIGRAKSGKTTATAWVVSQSILSEINVLWIDTEQGLYYGSRTQHWILAMSGEKSSPYLKFYDLKIFNPNQRVEMIEWIIKDLKPDLVVVDGIRDLIFDINNPEQATLITGDLMRWAEQYNCHIMNILHQNKGNEHARGHLGTEMINKSETVMKVEQNEDKLIVCTPEYTRSKEFEAFAFDRDEAGMPTLVEGYSGKIETNSGDNRRIKKVDPWDPAYNDSIPEIVDYCFKDAEFLTRSNLKENIINYFNKNGVEIGDPKARGFMARLFDSGIIWTNPHIKKNAKVHKNPKYIPPAKWVESPKVENLYKIPLSTKFDDDEEPPF